MLPQPFSMTFLHCRLSVSARDDIEQSRRVTDRAERGIPWAMLSFGEVSSQEELSVALVLPSLAAGGTERIATFMANHWARRGWLVTVVTLEAENTEPYYPTDPRVRVLRLGLPPAPGHRVQALKLVMGRALRLRRT